MTQRLKPTNDFIFKKLFGEKGAEERLLALLNAILGLKDKRQLTYVEIIENRALYIELIDDKASRLDVRAKTSDGTQYDIEIQITDHKNMDKRSLYYWSKLFVDGVKKGEDYIELPKIIAINILNFNFLKIDKYHSSFHIWEDECKDFMLTDALEIHMIEMPKFRALKEKNMKEEPLHRWMMFLEENVSEEVLKELIEMDTSIRNAEERLEYLSSDPIIIERYRKREESLYERNNMINGAKAEGKAEVALAAIKKGLPVELVADITGLSLDEVKELATKVQCN